MSSVECFDVVDGCDGGVLKPGEVSEGQKIFSISQDRPNPIFSHVLNFSDRIVFSKREGFHCVAPQQSVAIVSVRVPEALENEPMTRWVQYEYCDSAEMIELRPQTKVECLVRPILKRVFYGNAHNHVKTY